MQKGDVHICLEEHFDYVWNIQDTCQRLDGTQLKFYEQSKNKEICQNQSHVMI